MGDFFREGGWAMYPVLIFGVVMIGAAARYAWDGERARIRFLVANGVLLLVAMSHGMLMNMAMVFHYVEDATRAPDGQLARIVFTGLKESSRPWIMGGGLLVLALVLVAVGTYREVHRELRARAA